MIEKPKKLNGSDYGDLTQGITNLYLQKVLFYAQAEYFQKYHKPLFFEEIEAWRYGPVVPEVYNWLRHCLSSPIIDFDVDDRQCSELDEKTKQFLDDIWI